MNRKLTALLLSMLVIPGLGHLYLGRKVKGAVLLVLINILILAAAVLLLKTVGPALAAKSLGASLSTAEIISLLERHAASGKILLAVFFGLWCYGAADILKDRPDAPEKDLAP